MPSVNGYKNEKVPVLKPACIKVVVKFVRGLERTQWK